MIIKTDRNITALLNGFHFMCLRLCLFIIICKTDKRRLSQNIVQIIKSDIFRVKWPKFINIPDQPFHDRQISEEGIPLDALGQEVFSATVLDKSPEALLSTDFKEFHLADHRLGISQITTMDSAAVLKKKDALLEEMAGMKEKNGYDMVLLMITDVLREGTELLFLGDQEIIRQAFSVSRHPENQVFLPRIMSRKKQMVPALALLWG